MYDFSRFSAFLISPKEIIQLMKSLFLLNGEVIETSEAYDLPVEKGLVGKFEKADKNEICPCLRRWDFLCAMTWLKTVAWYNENVEKIEVKNCDLKETDT